MPKLYLLRHAEAGSALSGDDKDRPLTPRGQEQAAKIATHIKDIDICLCSTAKRTQMTLEIAHENGAEIKKIEFFDELYNAPAGSILATLQKRSEQNILIVAHNPGIHQLAGTLVGDGVQEQVEKLRLFYNPATLSAFDCPLENWQGIQPQENTLVDLVIPD